MIETDLLYAFVKKEDLLKNTAEKIMIRIVNESSALYMPLGNVFMSFTTFQERRELVR